MSPMADDTYLMLGDDGTVRPADLGPMMRRHRASVVDARAARIAEMTELLGCEAFDVEGTFDTARDAGLAAGEMDAAGNVALALAQVEELRR
jgi:hypothetical protein